MPDFVRRIVSGAKARHVDPKLGFDLDLVYVTDRLIIMGWPASNLEALYRNRRKDVRRFLDTKHGEKYRVYNLCPCSENTYDDNEFYGAVSRYPFPDHHPPPLSMIPMFVADLTAWLAEDPSNVAVIHCKAGKGRSGTMACSYLLSLPILPPSPQNPRNLGNKHDQKALESQRKARSLARANKENSTGNEQEAIGESQGGVLHAMPLVSPSSSAGLVSDAGFLHPSQATLRASSPSRMDHIASSDSPEMATLEVPGDDGNRRPGSSRYEAISKASSDFGDTRETTGSNDPQSDKMEEMRSRLTAVFEFHTSRRLKPAKSSAASSKSSPAQSRPASRHSRAKEDAPSDGVGVEKSGSPKSSPSRRKSMSNLVGTLARKASHFNLAKLQGQQQGSKSNTIPSLDKPTEQQHYIHKAATKSGTDLRTLGATPAGKSCNDLSSILSPPTSIGASSSTLSLGATANQRTKAPFLRLEKSTPESSEAQSQPMSEGIALPSSDAASSTDLERANFVVSPSRLNSGEESTGEEEERQVGMRSIQSRPRLAVSIPSQRRWVGYWARVLANMDPRAALDPTLFNPMRRTVKITRIYVDRLSTKKEGEGSNENALSVQIARYDSQLVEKLERWERGARRRQRVFGALDPRMPAPDLPPSDYIRKDDDDEEEEDMVEGESSKSESAAKKKELWQKDHDRRWRDAEKKNREHRAEYDRKLRQHGNDTGVGQWGINVLAEKDDIRSFHWKDDEEDGNNKDDKHRACQMETLALVSEDSREVLAKERTQELLSKGEEMGGPCFLRYGFEVGKEDTTHFGIKTPRPTWTRPPAATTNLLKGFQGTHKKNASAPSNNASNTSSDTSYSRSTGGTPAVTTPASPITSEEDIRSESRVEEGKTLVVDADREICFKVLVGRTGATHSLLPDVLAAGYLWFIPAFETPLLDGASKPKKGQVVQCQFGLGEIDFRKGKKAAPLLGGGDIRNVTVEFEWVEVGWHEADEEEE